MPKMIIDIDSENVNYVELLNDDGTAVQDLIDCTGSGQQSDNVQYVADTYDVEFHIVAQNAEGNYENRLATDDEMRTTVKNIWFESETDFTDMDNVRNYLIFDAAHRLEDQLSSDE